MRNIEKSLKVIGWSWAAFLLGPFWYIMTGLNKKGFILLAIAVLSVGLAAPFIWIYCGFRANTDLYEHKLQKQSSFEIDKI